MIYLKHSLDDIDNKKNFKVSVEAVIEKMYKLNGTERQEIDCNQLVLEEEAPNLIELDIIISPPQH